MVIRQTGPTELWILCFHKYLGTCRLRTLRASVALKGMSRRELFDGYPSGSVVAPRCSPSGCIEKTKRSGRARRARRLQKAQRKGQTTAPPNTWHALPAWPASPTTSLRLRRMSPNLLLGTLTSHTERHSGSYQVVNPGQRFHVSAEGRLVPWGVCDARIFTTACVYC